MRPPWISSAIEALRKGRFLFIFTVFVLLPIIPLAYLALQSIPGDQEPVSDRINARLRSVGETVARTASRPLLDCVPEFSRRVRPGLSISALAAEVSEWRKSCACVSDVFLLDHRLRPLHPFREPAERSADLLIAARQDEGIVEYSRAMRAGSAREFISRDPAAAMEDYHAAADRAGSPQMKAIAALSQARCAMKAERYAEAGDLYRAILEHAGEAVSYNGLSLRLLSMDGAAEAEAGAGRTSDAAERRFDILRGLAAGELACDVDEAVFYASMITEIFRGSSGPPPPGFEAVLREWAVTERSARAMERLRSEFAPDFTRAIEEGGGPRILARTAGGEETLVACLPIAAAGEARPALLVAALDGGALRGSLAGILRDAAASEPDVNISLLDPEGRAIASRGDPGGASPHVLTRPLAPVLPAWQLRLAYRRDGILYQLAARERRARLTYSTLLLSIIFLGLYLIYRLVKKDSELARLKGDFVSRVSHELRTPLSTIRAVGEMLEMGAVSSREKEMEYFTYITSEGRRLSRLIDNVLDFSRIGAGKRSYALRPADIGATVSSTVNAFRQYASPDGFRISYEADPDIPRVLADEDAVSQALINLLDNAVKFSREEKAVRVRLRRRGGEVLLSVCDRGIGIARTDIPKIFAQFYRLDEGSAVARKGAGIGLSIVKHIAEAHGGRVEVRSALGEGSDFTIVIPALEEDGR